MAEFETIVVTVSYTFCNKKIYKQKSYQTGVSLRVLDVKNFVNHWLTQPMKT